MHACMHGGVISACARRALDDHRQRPVRAMGYLRMARRTCSLLASGEEVTDAQDSASMEDAELHCRCRRGGEPPFREAASSGSAARGLTASSCPSSAPGCCSTAACAAGAAWGLAVARGCWRWLLQAAQQLQAGAARRVREASGCAGPGSRCCGWSWHCWWVRCCWMGPLGAQRMTQRWLHPHRSCPVSEGLCTRCCCCHCCSCFACAADSKITQCLRDMHGAIVI